LIIADNIGGALSGRSPAMVAKADGMNQDAPTWLAYLDRVIACAEDIAKTASVQGDDAKLFKLKMLVACLLARSISTTRAVVDLIGLGRVVEVRMLTRSIFENEFYLCRLAQDGNAFVREMEDDDLYYRKTHGKTMFREKQAREALGEKNQARLRAIVKGLQKKSSKPKPLKLGNVISGSDISAAYRFYQQLSSDSGHPSLTALRRHFDESGGNARLKPRIKDGESPPL
jgi:hypothetical protein